MVLKGQPGLLSHPGLLSKTLPQRSYKLVVQSSGQWLSEGREKEEKEQEEEGQGGDGRGRESGRKGKGRKGGDIALIKRTQSR